MKTIYTAALFTLVTFSVKAQLISQFTWENGSTTQAAFGPNASSISSYAVVSTGGANGTKGLNPGTGNHDINMILPGSSFTVSSLDISVDFRRKESQASFFTLGSLDFGMNGGSLYAKFLLSQNSLDVTVNLTNLYNLPTDNAFHTYRFIYNANSGAATVAVDGAVVGSYQAPAGTSLSWTGAGNATVGQLMDGTSNNVAVLDNLIIKNPLGFSTLPLQLLSFDAAKAGIANLLTWKTTHEIEVRSFTIERSTDGVVYEAIGVVAARQDYTATNAYSFTDNMPAAVNFYRLKMTDLDGSFTYSPVKKVSGSAAVSITCYPNPVVSSMNVKTDGAGAYRYTLFTLDGKVMQSGVITGGQVSLDVSGAPKGMMIVRVEGALNTTVQTFKISKL